MKRISGLLFFLFSLSACAQVETPSVASVRLLEDYSIEEIDSVFREKNETFRLQALDTLVESVLKELNGALLIAVHDKVIVRENTGLLRFYDPKKSYEGCNSAELRTLRNSKENRIHNHTFYELASISKQFTAAAVLKLVESGKMKLTDSLYRFYPELPYRNVTIHQLLSHTSGLPEYFDFPISYFDTTHLLTNQELVAVLAEKKPAVIFQPGYNYKYTNTNYALLAAIVEKVADLRFEEYVRQHIFLPAGMKHTFFITEIDERESLSISKGHLKSKYELPRYYLDGTVGDKGVYSTPEELLKWKIAYFDKKKIISPELLHKATSKQNFIKGKGVAKELYGYGLRLEDNPDLGKLIYHGGLWRGYQHIMTYHPEENIFIVFLSNHRNGAHLGKCNEILQILNGS